MSLTRIGVVSTDTVAVCIPAAVVSTTAPSFFLLHAASAAENITAPATATARIVGLMVVASGVGNCQLQSGVDQVRVGNLVGVCGVDLLPLRGIAVELFGDLAEVVAFLDRVRLVAGGRSRRMTGAHVGEVRCAARAAGTGAAGASDVGEVGVGVVVEARHFLPPSKGRSEDRAVEKAEIVPRGLPSHFGFCGGLPRANESTQEASNCCVD